MLLKEKKSPLSEIYFWDIFKGLLITRRNMLFTKSVTIQYPEERRNYSDRFRGMHYIKATNGVENCTACMLCPTVCPPSASTSKPASAPTRKSIRCKFEIDMLRCCFCGMCEEACPKDAIKLSTIYEMSTSSRDVWDKPSARTAGKQVNGISPVLFLPLRALAIACSLLVVLKKNPVASAFSLVLVFFAFAGIYALLDAHLVAALQVLVYAGAIMVLFIFVIMLLNADTPSFDLGRSHIAIKVAAAIAVRWRCLACLSGFSRTRAAARRSPISRPRRSKRPAAIRGGFRADVLGIHPAFRADVRAAAGRDRRRGGHRQAQSGICHPAQRKGGSR